MVGKTKALNRAVLSAFISGVHKLAAKMNVAVMVISSIDDDVAIQFIGDDKKSSGVKSLVGGTEIRDFFLRTRIPMRFECPADTVAEV